MLARLIATLVVVLGFALVLSGLARHYVRRLRWLVALAGACSACSALNPIPGHIVDKPGLADDESIVWKDAYGRSDRMPEVLIVEETQLDCTGRNGYPGFDCPTLGCRQGCTGSPFAVHMIDVLPRSKGLLAHECWHVIEIRTAIATLLYTPATFEGYMALSDRDHSGPAWQPGGAVEKANKLLAERGR